MTIWSPSPSPAEGRLVGGIAAPRKRPETARRGHPPDANSKWRSAFTNRCSPIPDHRFPVIAGQRPGHRPMGRSPADSRPYWGAANSSPMLHGPIPIRLKSPVGRSTFPYRQHARSAALPISPRSGRKASAPHHKPPQFQGGLPATVRRLTRPAQPARSLRHRHQCVPERQSPLFARSHTTPWSKSPLPHPVFYGYCSHYEM